MSAKQTRLYHRLQIAAHRVQKAADRAILSAADITTAQAAVLSVVSVNQPVSQRIVADQLGLNESAMTAMVSRLLKLGLLDRTRDAQDARSWSLTVSPQGRTAMKRIEKPFETINHTIESTLTEREVERLADYLARLGKAFNAN